MFEFSLLFKDWFKSSFFLIINVCSLLIINVDLFIIKLSILKSIISFSLILREILLLSTIYLIPLSFLYFGLHIFSYNSDVINL